MIASLAETKRCLAWEARLDSSSLRLEAAEGERRALWVFDNLRGPDGFALRDMMLALARQEQLMLFSFGPRNGRRLATARGVARALAPRWNESYRLRVAQQVQRAAAECRAALFLVGAAKGMFATALPLDTKLWEVQHGLLDTSYFPLRAERFFTRSASSRALLQQMAPDTQLTVLGNDLSPPPMAPGDLARARAVVCYSKNPGGGCTAAQLAQFERAVVDLAHRLSLPVQIKLHPRDSRLKLMARHRNVAITHYLKPLDPPAEPRLVVSSFSTALAAETRTGDLLLNVAMSAPNAVIAAEYAWLPSVELADLTDVAGLSAMERR